MHCNLSPSPSSRENSFNIRRHPSASVSSCSHMDVDDDISELDINVTDSRRRRRTNDENLRAKVSDSCTSTATGVTLSVPSREHSTSDRRATTSANVTLKPSPKLLRVDKLFTAETSTAFRPTKQAPSSDVDDTEQLSNSDNCSDVWIPRTSSTMSGIWIVCDQASSADSLRSARHPQPQRAYKYRAEFDPDPVFRRRVPGGMTCPAECSGRTDIDRRSSETVDRRLTAQDRRRAWQQAAAVKCRTRHADSDLTSRPARTCVVTRPTSQPRSTHEELSPDLAVAEAEAVVQLIVDEAETNFHGTDNQPQPTQDAEQSRPHLLHIPLSVLSPAAGNLIERLISLRHSRPSVHEDRHKQQIENRARKALRTISINSTGPIHDIMCSWIESDFMQTSSSFTGTLF